MADSADAVADVANESLAAQPIPSEKPAGATPDTTTAKTQQDQAWSQHDYYDQYCQLFSPVEAQRIVELSTVLERQESKLQTGSGLPLRDCSIFWIHRGHGADWVLDRVAGMVHAWNRNYRFEIAANQPAAAQLTLYRASQEYSWHMDLGAGPSSLRKVSVVVGLNDPAHYTGGGTEIFYGGGENPTLRLGAGDAIVFPPYVMHRAIPVETGERWTLALWFLGDRPLR
jgi:PKHD-type hydroxylase